VTTFEEYQVQQRNWWIFPRKSSISKKWFRCKWTWENCPTLHLDINLSKGTSSLWLIKLKSTMNCSHIYIDLS
jgi:hypothetical protein